MNFKNIETKRTKLVATSGPTFQTEAEMEKMFKAGVNVVRLNTSHGDYEEHKQRVVAARAVAKKLGINISIVLDTKGPEIRIHKFKNGSIKVEEGQRLNIHPKEIEGDDNNFSTTYTEIYKILEPGQPVLCDDGKLSLEVVSVDETTHVVELVAKNHHTLKSGKAVNVPGAQLDLPFISEHDKGFLLWGTKNKVDFIAASFVTDKKDMLEMRKLLDDNGGKGIEIFPKIEALRSLKNLNDIFSVSDGVMLARGDLGVEIPFEEVPFFQSLIVKKCLAFGLPIIIATQMLDSMIENPRPTRAEVTDVYQAVMSGADSTMLSGESANGEFPTEAVEAMTKIQREAEKDFDYLRAYQDAFAVVPSLNAETAYEVAKKALRDDIDYILAFSKNGNLVKALSRFRPASIIVAMLEKEELLTKFGPHKSVYTQKVDNYNDFESDEKVNDYCEHMGITGKIIVANKSSWRLITVEKK